MLLLLCRNFSCAAATSVCRIDVVRFVKFQDATMSSAKIVIATRTPIVFAFIIPVPSQSGHFFLIRVNSKATRYAILE